MRIVVHDYGGYAFPAQLSRELARRGHQVLHLFATSIQSSRGELERRPTDPAGLVVSGIDIPGLKQRSLVKRWRQERRYGQLLAARVRSFQPDIVISANAPLDAQATLLSTCRKADVRFIHWWQDIYSQAIQKLLHQRLPVLSTLVGRYYGFVERKILRSCDHAVLISDDFLDFSDAWGVPRERVSVIPNWAPLEWLPTRPRSNPWAQQHGLADGFNFIYAGTLGMKHNLDLLLQLAKRYRDTPQVRVVVISEGGGANWLRENAEQAGLENIRVLPFQPFKDVPNVFASADVLVAILKPEAGVFSVPSKVLSYLCAQRPLLLAVPGRNLAARIVLDNECGLVTDPNDAQAFLKASAKLHGDPQLSERLGANGRACAERDFSIATFTDRFEGAFGAVPSRVETQQPIGFQAMPS